MWRSLRIKEFHDNLALVVTQWILQSSVLLCTFQKLTETTNTITLRLAYLHEKCSACLSHQVSGEETVPRGIKHASKRIVEYIQPHLIKSGYSGCFTTEEIESLFVDTMPHADQQFSFTLYSQWNLAPLDSPLHIPNATEEPYWAKGRTAVQKDYLIQQMAWE